MPRNSPIDVLKDIRSLVEISPETELEREKEQLRLKLAFNMVAAREFMEKTQQELAGIMGVTQPWISKLESPNYDHQIESLLDYVSALGGELSLELKVGGAVFRILEFEHEVTFELPELHVDADYPATTTGSMVDTSSANVLVTDEMSVQNELPAVVNS